MTFGLTFDAALGASNLPLSEARSLAAAALGLTRAQLVTRGPHPLASADAAVLEALFARRRAGEPVAYLTGEREFYGLSFKVTPAVLIPRPETELLVDFALEVIADNVPARILDLGTGSGCIAVAIASHRPAAFITAVDRSADALAVASGNARRRGVRKAEFKESDWFTALAGARFDLIVANPPYVAAADPHLRQGDLRFEPAAALASGAEGLDAIRAITAAAPTHLAAGGRFAFEHGYDQGASSRALLTSAGFEGVFTRKDLAGHERVSGGRLS
jgi:release factor glutamine methyltransferase